MKISSTFPENVKDSKKNIPVILTCTPKKQLFFVYDQKVRLSVFT